MAKRGTIILFILILLIPLVEASFLVRESMFEGDIHVYKTVDENGELQGTYILKAYAVLDKDEKAIIELNGERSDPLHKDGRHVFKDGSEIQMRTVMITEAGEGRDFVEFYFWGSGVGTKTHISSLEQAAEADVKLKENKLECIRNSDCDDNIEYTEDECFQKECRHTINQSVETDENCMNAGDVFDLKDDEWYFCNTQGEWKKQRSLNVSCNEDYQCLSAICSLGVCSLERAEIEPEEDMEESEEPEDKLIISEEDLKTEKAPFAAVLLRRIAFWWIV